MTVPFLGCDEGPACAPGLLVFMDQLQGGDDGVGPWFDPSHIDSENSLEVIKSGSMTYLLSILYFIPGGEGRSLPKTYP